MRRFDRLGLVAVKLPAGALIDLAIADTVRRVSLDAPVQSTATLFLSPAPTNVLSVYSARKSNHDYLRSLMPVHLQTVLAPVPGTPNAYLDGQGIGVAIVDSGVERQDDLRHRMVQYDFVSSNTTITTTAARPGLTTITATARSSPGFSAATARARRMASTRALRAASTSSRCASSTTTARA